MIDASYTVTCDGDPEHGCEAEFTYDAFGKVADLAGLVNQIEKRGWKRNGKRTICPLHTADTSPTEGNRGPIVCRGCGKTMADHDAMAHCHPLGSPTEGNPE